MRYAPCSMRYAFFTALPDPPAISIAGRSDQDILGKLPKLEILWNGDFSQNWILYENGSHEILQNQSDSKLRNRDY